MSEQEGRFREGFEQKTTDPQANLNTNLYSRRLGLRPYIIAAISPEDREQWKKQIDEIHSALKTKKPDQIGAVILQKGALGESGQKYLKGILAVLNENLSEREQTILAIGIWYLREKGPWHGAGIGEIVAGMKLVIGGEHNPASFLGENAQQPSCLDSSVIIGEMAKEFGIEGAVYTIGTGRYSHRLWKSDEGEISDALWGWKRGGVFKNEDAYREYVEQNPDLSKLHGKKGTLHKEF